jgi:hypothetical protein
MWDYAATGCLFDEPHCRVDDHVRADTRNQSVRNRVGERHDRNRQESRDGVAHVPPVDVLGRGGHERTDDDQGAASRPRRDRREDGGEEHGDEEAQTGEHGSETSLATLGDTGSGLDEGGDWWRTHERPDGNADGVNSVGDGGSLKVLCALIDRSTKAGHGVERASSCKCQFGSRYIAGKRLTVKNIDIEEGDESETPLTSILRHIPLLYGQDASNWVESNDLLEKVEVVITKFGVGEVGDRSSTGPGDYGDEENAEDNGTFDSVHHEHDRQDTSEEDTQPHGRASHLVRVRAEAGLGIQQRLMASCKLERSGTGSYNHTNT